MNNFSRTRILPGLAIIAGASIGLPCALALDSGGRPGTAPAIVAATAAAPVSVDYADAEKRALTAKGTVERAAPGASFMTVASAAGLSQEAPLRTGETDAAAVTWVSYAAALLGVGLLGVVVHGIRRAREESPSAWSAPVAQTVPNFPKKPTQTPTSFAKSNPKDLVTIESRTKAGSRQSPNSQSMSSDSRSKPRTPSLRDATRAGDSVSRGAPSAADALSMAFDADMVEERMIRAEWAKAMKDGAIDLGGDSILKAIEQAERELEFDAPQMALDQALDDELIKLRVRR